MKVTGTGEYAGAITKRFMITSGDIGVGSSSSGCNAAGGLCAVLGLAFVIRKFRRR